MYSSTFVDLKNDKTFVFLGTCEMIWGLSALTVITQNLTHFPGAMLDGHVHKTTGSSTYMELI